MVPSQSPVFVTVIVPMAVPFPHPPVSVTVYVEVPATLGVPLIVIVFDDHTPVTPEGNPEKVAPVAVVVA